MRFSAQQVNSFFLPLYLIFIGIGYFCRMIEKTTISSIIFVQMTLTTIYIIYEN